MIELLGDYELGEYIVGSLVSIGQTAIPDLIATLTNPDPEIRILILQCIGWIEDEKGIRACIPYLKDKNKEVQCQTICLL